MEVQCNSCEVLCVVNIVKFASPSDSEVDRYVIIRVSVSQLSTYEGRQNRNTRDLVQHIGLLFRTIACSRYDVHPKTKNTN
jgi:hypothetical protein